MDRFQTQFVPLERDWYLVEMLQFSVVPRTMSVVVVSAYKDTAVNAQWF